MKKDSTIEQMRRDFNEEKKDLNDKIEELKAKFH